MTTNTSINISADGYYNFAGFTFPRRLADLAQGPAALRAKRKQRQYTGGYATAPTPDDSGSKGFYLDDAGQPFTRWQRADDVIQLRHKGWYCDRYQDQTIFGIVVNLPHGRYLAGWSMGRQMASAVERDVYTDPDEAARMADEHARVAAENQLEAEDADEAAENQLEAEDADL